MRANRVYELNVPMDLSECSLEDALYQLRADPLVLCVSRDLEWTGRKVSSLYTVHFEVDLALPTDAWYLRSGSNIVFSPGACNEERSAQIRGYLAGV